MKEFKIVMPVEGVETYFVEAENLEQAIELVNAGDGDFHTGDYAFSSEKPVIAVELED